VSRNHYTIVLFAVAKCSIALPYSWAVTYSIDTSIHITIWTHVIAGCIMIFAWVMFTGVGILAARYYKNAWADKTFLGLKIWFQVPTLTYLCIFVILDEIFLRCLLYLFCLCYSFTCQYKKRIVLSIDNVYKQYQYLKQCVSYLGFFLHNVCVKLCNNGRIKVLRNSLFAEHYCSNLMCKGRTTDVGDQLHA